MNGNNTPRVVPVVSIDRRFIPDAEFVYGPLSTVAPGIAALTEETDEPKALLFLLPNAEEIVFGLGEEGRKALVAALTGGIEVVSEVPQ